MKIFSIISCWLLAYLAIAFIDMSDIQLLLHAEWNINASDINFTIENSAMNVVYSWSGDIDNLGPAIYSVLNSIPNRSINFFVASNTRSQVPGFAKRLKEIKVKDVTFRTEYINSEITTTWIKSFSWDAYIRILFSDKHPEIQKFIQLDGDTMLLGDISAFYDKDLTGKYANVCLDKFTSCEGFSPYFNSGVMVFNAVKFRADNMLQKALDTLRVYEKTKNYWVVDQTVLNEIFHYNCIYSARKYNEYNIEYYNLAKIFHFYKIIPPYKLYKEETEAHKKWKCFKYFFQNKINPWEKSRYAKICDKEEDIKKYSDIISKK